MLQTITHWGRVTHICVSDPTSIGSDKGLSPGRRQAIIRTNTEILLKGPLGTNFSEILFEILFFSFKKMRLKVSSAKRRPFCLDLHVLKKHSVPQCLGSSNYLIPTLSYPWCHMASLDNGYRYHDDVIRWKHFPRNWPFVRGIHRSSVNSPHKGQWRWALMFSLSCVWINDWVNSREAGDLRRYIAHYDVIVMNILYGLSFH